MEAPHAATQVAYELATNRFTPTKRIAIHHVATGSTVPDSMKSDSGPHSDAAKLLIGHLADGLYTEEDIVIPKMTALALNLVKLICI
jgi:hypothetical protein